MRNYFRPAQTSVTVALNKIEYIGRPENQPNASIGAVLNMLLTLNTCSELFNIQVNW